MNGGELSRVRIAAATGLTSASVTQLVRELIGEGLLVEGDEIFGLTLGALVTPDTYAVHIEKSRRDVEGGYPYLAHSLAKALPETVKVLNREEDLGVPGLRKAKLSYYPELLLEKYTVREASHG